MSTARSRQLAWAGGLAVVAFGAFQIHRTAVQDPLLLLLGAALIALGAWPAIRWAHRAESRLPTFEIFALTFIPFYAFPIFEQRADVIVFGGSTVLAAAVAALLFLGSALLCFHATPAGIARSPVWSQPLLPDRFLRFASVGLFLTTCYQYLATFTEMIPPEFASILRALLYGIGMLCTFVLSRWWGEGRLTPGEKLFATLNLTAQIILHVVGLYLITGGSLLLLALIGYVSASRRLPLVVMVLALGLFGTLHLGKPQMRHIYWAEDAPVVRVSDLPDYFSEWLGYSLAARAEAERGTTARLLERASLFHVLCRIIDVVPERQDYLGGETYALIPAQFVPRLLWPDKPGPHASNRRLAIYFGFVPNEEAAERVSIAIGIPSEAYANFGLPGVLLLGAFFGFIYKKVVTLTQHSPALSIGGLTSVLLLAWSLQAEMTMAVWVSSLYQAAIVLIGAPVVARKLFGW